MVVCLQNPSRLRVTVGELGAMVLCGKNGPVRTADGSLDQRKVDVLGRPPNKSLA